MARGTADHQSDVPTVFSDKLRKPLRRDTVTVPACPNTEGSCLASKKDPQQSQFGYVVFRMYFKTAGVILFHVSVLR